MTHFHDKAHCHQPDVPSEACYLRFGPEPVAGAFALRWETVRGEMVVIDLTKDGKVVGVELFKPGKPCQPTWQHLKPWGETKADEPIVRPEPEDIEVPGPQDEEQWEE